MGSYLSKPKTEKTSHDIESNQKYDCGYSGMQGWRSNMEDAHSCEPNADENIGFFGVYDGHGGSEVATYVALHFLDALKKCPEYNRKEYAEALKKTFLELDAGILKPETIRELTYLSTLDPNLPLPTLEQLKNIDDLESSSSEDEDETRLLNEEADMNIEDVLARYQQQEAWTEKNAEEKASPSKSAAGGSNGEDKKPEVKVEEKDVEVKEQQCEDKKEVAEEKDVVTSPELKSEAAAEEITAAAAPSAAAPAATATDSPPKKVKLVKLKPQKRANPAENEEDDEDDDDFKVDAREMAKSYTDDDSDEEGEGWGLEKDSDEDESEDGEEKDSDEKDSEDDDSDDDDEDNTPIMVTADMLNGGAPVAGGIMQYLKEQQNQTEVPGNDSGTTAVVALVVGNKVIVANAGDSRCVVCRQDGKVFDMSDDHKPEDQIELERIEKAGGHVNEQGRVNGGLNLSRAIGDHTYKKNSDLNLEDQMITALPDIRTIDLQTGDEFMVLACDGIWNVLSSQEVVDFVLERLNPVSEAGVAKEPMKLSTICEEMFNKCMAPDTLGDGTGCDNMTCMIVRFDQKWLATCGATAAASNGNSTTAVAAADDGDDQSCKGDQQPEKSVSSVSSSSVAVKRTAASPACASSDANQAKALKSSASPSASSTC